MAYIDKLAERHIIEHESHLKRIDELLARGEQVADEGAEGEQSSEKLMEFKGDREKLSEHIEKLKNEPAEYWQKKSFEKAGPIGAWDAIAESLEGLLERIGDKSKPK